MAQPLINGRAYSWAEIDVRIGRTPVYGIIAITYDEEQEMEDNFGKGNRPVSRGYGNITTTGSITLDMEEIEALQDASITGRLQDLEEFDITVSYQPEGGVIRTHKLKNCRFKTNGRTANQGDMRISQEIQLQIAEIKWRP